MAGVTLDSGALIGFEWQNRRALTHIKLAQLTSDFDDLDRLRSYFPNVRLLQT